MGMYVATSINEYLSNNIDKKSTDSFEMVELLKTTPIIKSIERPSGRFLHSIELVLVDETFINELEKIVGSNNWYIERCYGTRYTITQIYVIDAKVKTIPKKLYHATFTKNIDSILGNGLVPKSEDTRHKYPARIYVSDNIRTLEPLIKELKRWKGNEDFSIIEIDTKKLNFELYIDTTSAYKGHLYIQGIDVIPKENIKLLSVSNIEKIKSKEIKG